MKPIFPFTTDTLKKRMAYIGFLMVMALAPTGVQGQDVGLSFSYFIPKNGYISTPVSPFSFRGLGKNLTPFLSIETGGTLYRMSGLNLKGLPFQSKSPLLGPNFTVFIPLELVLELRGNGVEFDIKGGGFFFYGFDQKLNEGNFDRAIRQFEGWTVANSDLSFKNHPGFGYHGGAELIVSATKQVSVSLECNYLMGQAKFPLTGNYTGGTATLSTVPVDYANAKVDFTGLEFSIGLFFKTNAGPNKPKPRKRR